MLVENGILLFESHDFGGFDNQPGIATAADIHVPDARQGHIRADQPGIL